MKIFPTNNYRVTFTTDSRNSLETLKANTKESSDLTSQITDKMFIGRVGKNSFKIIGSELGIGAFTVFKGDFNETTGVIKTEINNAFKILIAVLYFLPIIAVTLTVFKTGQLRSLGLLIPLFMAFLFIRFIITSLAYKFSSNITMQKLKKVLNIQILK